VLKFVQVLGFVQVGVCKLGCSHWVFKLGFQVGFSSWVFKLGFQVGVFKFALSRWGVQVGTFCGFLVSIL
jgi:hypothetical protein